MTGTDVAVGLRRTKEFPTNGEIIEFGLALFDRSRWEVTDRAVWTATPMSLIGRMTMANMAAGMDMESLGSLTVESLVGGQTWGAVCQQATEWWDTHVGAPKATVFGFRPDVTKLWLVHHAGVLAERFGDTVDLATVWWMEHGEFPSRPERVGDEFDLIGGMG